MEIYFKWITSHVYQILRCNTSFIFFSLFKVRDNLNLEQFSIFQNLSFLFQKVFNFMSAI